MMIKYIFPSLIFLFSFIYSNYLKAQQSPESWVVPESNKTMKNPYTSDKEALSIGKLLYAQHCRLCHGKKGIGDGSGGRDLDTKVSDLTSDVVQSQTEGALFYKITNGRKDMPEYRNKISDEEDRWNLVSYILSTF